jgi:mersacidin/lichenicidin family type 2 lantibiotic
VNLLLDPPGVLHQHSVSRAVSPTVTREVEFRASPRPRLLSIQTRRGLQSQTTLLLLSLVAHSGQNPARRYVMTDDMIIRAWKDPKYRASLSPEEQAQLPEPPSGKPLRELAEDELGVVAGGLMACTCSCCSCCCC